MVMIKLASTEDWSIIVEFNAAMAKETENIGLDRSILTKGVQSTLSDSQKGWYYLAFTADKIIGQTMITLEWSDWRNGFWWWIQSVYVLPEYRKQGVFRSLYEHITEEAQSQSNVAGIRLYVDRDNIPAQNTYVQLGMEASHYRFFEKSLG